METSNRYITNVFVTGLFVVIVLSVLLFWCRWITEEIFLESVSTPSIGIKPSGLFPPEIENDPNVEDHSVIRASYMASIKKISLGIYQDLTTPDLYRFDRSSQASWIYHFEKSKDKENEEIWSLVYFDKRLGLFVCRESSMVKTNGRRRWIDGLILYAGPKGIAQKPDKTLGRFVNPLAARNKRSRHSIIPLYDHAQRSFFLINLKERTVSKGPEQAKDYKPIQIGLPVKNRFAIWPPACEPPLRRVTEAEDQDKLRIRMTIHDKEGKRIKFAAINNITLTRVSGKYMLVLEETGWIRKLDIETLKLSNPAGRLPSITSHGHCTSSRPRDLFAYNIEPVYVDGEYTGLISSSLSREGLCFAVSVFDKDGKLSLVRQVGNYTRAECIEPSKAPGGLTYTIVKFILENLQPPAFSLPSYFTASSFEATAGHRALFILPNSFVAFFGRYIGESFIYRCFFVLLLISPSIVLGALLAWRLVKDATIVGLSRRTRLCWLISTICFGLSAYITYRLTKPKITMVTCANCGRLRRPDMDRCHRCQSRWHMPELIPPAWRVIEIPDEKATI